MLQKMMLFLKESRQELKRVNWPSRQETIRLTLIVVGMSLVVAMFLGIIDFGLAEVLKKVIFR